MKIVNIQFQNGKPMAIFDNHNAEYLENIEGNAIEGSSVKYENGIYKVTGAGDTTCEV